MKRTLTLALALLLPAALCLPAAALDGEIPEGAAAGSETSAPAKAAKKPAAKKKKAAKKKAKKPVSEYKFEAVEKTPTYKFDREAAPITKDKKKPAKKAAKKSSKKRAKKPAKKAQSEYKFQAVEKTPAYKMDKNADPIVKAPKKKKKAAPKKPAEAPREGWGGEASGAVLEAN